MKSKRAEPYVPSSYTSTLGRGTAVERAWESYFKENLLHRTMSPGEKKNPNPLAGIINGENFIQITKTM